MAGSTPTLISDGHGYLDTLFGQSGGGNHYAGSNNYHGEYRFGPVNIPQGSTINTAVLTIQVNSSQNVTLTWYGNLAPDAPALANAEGWSRTTASVTMNGPPGTGAEANSLTTIVQELVDQASWSNDPNDNDMAFALMAGTPYADANDGNYLVIDTATATLVITYTAPGGGGLLPRTLLLGVG